MCFGTLAQRAEPSRCTSSRSWPRASRALRILDVNLRQHYFSPRAPRAVPRLANVLKLNDAELPVLAAIFGADGSAEAQLGACAPLRCAWWR